MKIWLVCIVGILAIALLEAIALLKNIDGRTLALSFTIIGSGITAGAIKAWSMVKSRGDKK